MTTALAPDRPPPPGQRRSSARPAKPGMPGRQHLAGLAAWIIGLLFVIPVVWMVLTSFHSEIDAAPTRRTSSPRSPWTATGSSSAATSGASPWPLADQLGPRRRSVSTILVIVLAIPAAYALSVKPVQKWTDVMFFFLSTKMLPAVAGLLPLYLIAMTIGLLDNIWFLIDPVHRDEPADRGLDDALVPRRHPARAVRGRVASTAPDLIQTLRRIIVPIISPGIAATALICFIFAWNELLLANMLTSVVAADRPGLPDQLRHLAGPVPGQGLRRRHRRLAAGADRRIRRPGQAGAGPVAGSGEVSDRLDARTEHRDPGRPARHPGAGLRPRRRSPPASCTSGSAGSTAPTRRCTWTG